MMLTWGRDGDKVYHWSVFSLYFNYPVLTCCFQGPDTLVAVCMHLMSSPTLIPWESQGLTLSHGPWNLILHDKYIVLYIWIG